jgi:hypothetical protein
MSESKMNIILDLDQTIISAESTDDYDFKKNKSKAKNFVFHDMDGYYIVFERPGLQKFLDYLFVNCNVSVWTAASKDYALFIIDKIILKNKANRNLDWIFFSYHCDISKNKKNGSKNLAMLWDVYKLKGYNKDNTIIIDDYEEVYETQPDNCIIAVPFEFEKENSYKDKYLKDLKKQLSKSKSVSEINKGLGTI